VVFRRGGVHEGNYIAEWELELELEFGSAGV